MKYRCPKCTLEFDAKHEQCPHCGYYSMYCEIIENELPDFRYEYIEDLSPNNLILTKAKSKYSSPTLFIINEPFSLDNRRYEMQVHSFTKSDKYYDVVCEFSEDGTELENYHCTCEDFYWKGHCCKHIIAAMMKIYEKTNKEKYGELPFLKKTISPNNFNHQQTTKQVTTQEKKTQETEIIFDYKKEIIFFVISLFACGIFTAIVCYELDFFSKVIISIILGFVTYIIRLIIKSIKNTYSK